VSMGRLHETPDDAVADTVRERVFIGAHTFTIERPAGLDKVFDHPAVRSAYAADEYIPYWTDLWAASRMLAKVVLNEPWPEPKPRVLEVACGLGLAGIAALAKGLHVTFSDVDATAVKFAALNAKLNGFTNFSTRPIDLRNPPDDLPYDVILASDLLYEQRMVEPVVEFLNVALRPAGYALLTDPDRISARSFKWAAEQAGLVVRPSFVRAGEPGGERTKGTLYRVSRG
jgi:ETFB lysine methyltransferase